MTSFLNSIPNDALKEMRRLCLISIESAIQKLYEAGSWPRPPRARILHIGHDFFYDDIKDINEVNQLSDLLSSQDFIKSTYLEKPGDKYIFKDYWIRLLVNTLSETDDINIKMPVFNKWFRRFINELYDDTYTWRSVDIIGGLKLNIKKLKLDESTILLRVPGNPWEWLDTFITRHDGVFKSLEFLRESWKGPFNIENMSLLVTTMKFKKNKYKGLRLSSVDLNNFSRSSALIAAIRLTKNGSPFLRSSSIFQLSYLPFQEPLGFTLREYCGLYEPISEISQSENQRIKKLWIELMKTVYGKPLFSQIKIDKMSIARSRFFSSYSEENWFQNMLDLTIALESLFSPTDNQELSHRISLRCAWLLGAELPNPSHSKIYECVRAMYDLRSSIVHGTNDLTEAKVGKLISKITGTRYEHSQHWKLQQSAIESARDVVRRSLRACYNLSKLPKNGPCWPFPNNFDNNIILPNQQKIWQKAAVKFFYNL